MTTLLLIPGFAPISHTAAPAEVTVYSRGRRVSLSPIEGGREVSAKLAHVYRQEPHVQWQGRWLRDKALIAEYTT